jgi:hypothetical protein
LGRVLRNARFKPTRPHRSGHFGETDLGLRSYLGSPTAARLAGGLPKDLAIALGTAFRSGGTESSNPASSSGESRANLRRVPSSLGIFALGPSRGFLSRLV